MGSLRMNYYKYQQISVPRMCFSVRRQALLFQRNPDTDKVLNLVPIPMLHILLGIVNKTFNCLVKDFPVANEWPRTLSIHQEHYHGHSFEGNESKKLLDHVTVLEEILERNGVLEMSMAYVNVFKYFKTILGTLYSPPPIDLEQLEKSIHQFRQAWKNTNMNLTCKAHIVIDHLLDFVRERADTSMAVFSEQSHEAAHCEFDKTWARYAIKEKSHPNFGKKLLKCILDFSAQHGK
jgi:hypothetical protein